MEVARRRSIHSITLKLSGAPGIERKKKDKVREQETREKQSKRETGKRGQYAKHKRRERKAKSKRNGNPFIIILRINLSMSVSIHSKTPYYMCIWENGRQEYGKRDVASPMASKGPTLNHSSTPILSIR